MKMPVRSLGLPEVPVSLAGFILAYAFYTMLAFQGPLMAYARPNIHLGTLQGLSEWASLEVIQIALMVIALLLLALLPVVVMKLFCLVALFCNAAALYFMTSYNVELDRTMIGNILNTDQGEVAQIWNPLLWAYLGLLAAVPGALIVMARIRKPRWLVRLGALAFAVFALIGWIYATSFTWLWFDQHIPRLGGRVLPWSYVVNLARYYNEQALQNRDQQLLPDAAFTRTVPAGQKDIVVLVIGEASRAQNYSAYGYGRDTNPFTRDAGIVVFPAGQSCATYTLAALACILTHQGREASVRTTYEPLPSYLTRMGVETIFRANNSGEPPVKVTTYERSSQIVAQCQGSDCPDPTYDEALLWGLEERLRDSTAARIFVTLHTAGSHGPSYWRKYPPAFNIFTPVCQTVELRDCPPQALVNAYDNSVRYADYLNARLITLLRGIPNARTVMIFVPDHGESLGENGLYLHGTPNPVAPDVQRRVPFMVWMSDSFMAAHGVSRSSILRDATFPDDFPFHSIMGAFGLKSAIYRPEYDIFAPREAAEKP